MSKYLLAIVCNSPMHTRNVTRLLCNFLDVEHRSMQAPVIDAIHCFTGMDKTAIAMDNKPFEVLPIVNSTMSNLKVRVNWALTQNNPSFLVDSLDYWLKNPEEKKNHDIFKGIAVTDIASDFQADYFRKNNGLVIHVLLENSRLPHPVKPRDSDLVIALKNSEPPESAYIYSFGQRIKNIYKEHLQGGLFNDSEAA